jgi:phosphoribosylformimino-5-aminoimidazole carboxamide ribotide isomerase
MSAVDTANPFVVAPAIDVLEGRCVRLAGGEPQRVTIEGGDPAEAAGRFAAEGAPLLHLVDLDGAFSGSPTPGLLERVLDAAGRTPVQAGGGYRTLEAVEGALGAGATRVIAGSAVLDHDFLREAASRFGDRFVAALDARDGRLAVAGWRKTSSIAALDHARACRQAGVHRLLVTSTARDGSLAGPDLRLLEDVLAASHLPVMAAGGVASLTDILRLKGIGCEGVVLGSALWSGRIALADALAVASDDPLTQGALAPTLLDR